MPQRSEESPEQAPAVVVHLVDGTWPLGYFRSRWPTLVDSLAGPRREPAWYERGSRFRSELAGDVPGQVLIKSFRWSGANSESTRERAARDLKVRIADFRRCFPTAVHVAVAHSHGGNIAMAATADSGPESASRLEGLATMATPFLSFRPFDNAQAAVVLRLYPLGVIVGAAMAILVALLLQGKVHAGNVLGISMAGGFAFQLAASFGRLRPGAVAKPPATPHPHVPAIVIRAPGDEASLVLATGEFVSHLTGLFWKYYTRPMIWVLSKHRTAASVLSGVFTLGFAMVLFDKVPDLWWGWVLASVSLLIAAIQFGAAIMLLPAGVAVAATLGPGMLVRSLRGHVQVDAVPAGWEGTVVNIDTASGPSAGGLNHSIYLHPATADRLRRWLRSLASPGLGPSDTSIADAQSLGDLARAARRTASG